MASEILAINNIRRNLTKLPPSKLAEVNDFIEFILKQSDFPKAECIEKFEGIWEGAGFEKIDNLNGQIREIRFCPPIRGTGEQF